MIVTFDDGAQTHVEQWGSAGPAMLCVHGMTGSRFSWTRLARHFSDRFRVFAYDQRGHGDSASVKGPMTLDRTDADLRAVCAAIGDVDVLAGHSWGGAVVLRGGRSTKARRVIAVDPVIYVPPHFDWHGEYVADIAQDLKLEGAALTAEYRKRYGEVGWTAEEIDAKLHAVATMTVEPLERLNTENDARNGGWDLRAVVAQYPKPLLLALADLADSTVTADERAWLAHNGGSNLATLAYDGEGHSLHRTAFDRFVKDADAWLAATA